MDLARLRSMQQDEYDDLAAFLRALPADGWEHPSLCDGWTVRDVVVHVVGWDELLVYRSLGEHVRRGTSPTTACSKRSATSTASPAST